MTRYFTWECDRCGAERELIVRDAANVAWFEENSYPHGWLRVDGWRGPASDDVCGACQTGAERCESGCVDSDLQCLMEGGLIWGGRGRRWGDQPGP